MHFLIAGRLAQRESDLPLFLQGWKEKGSRQAWAEGKPCTCFLPFCHYMASQIWVAGEVCQKWLCFGVVLV